MEFTEEEIIYMRKVIVASDPFLHATSVLKRVEMIEKELAEVQERLEKARQDYDAVLKRDKFLETLKSKLETK